jgi:uncharacterized protein (UPF0332 family)
MLDEGTRQRIERYLARAQQMLHTGQRVMEDGDYITAVNRAYYAVFYTANALLATQGLERSKHSGVIAAFRQHFVKAGLIEAEYSDFYGVLLEDRQRGDYDELEVLDDETARRDLDRARRFMERIEECLRRMEAL